MDIKNFASAIAQIAEEKGILPEKVFETIEMAIAAAYKKDYGKKGQIIKAKLDVKSGDVKFWQIKQVVDKDMIYSEEELEEMKEKSALPTDAPIKHREGEEDAEEGKKVRFNPERHIMLEDAKKESPKIKSGETLEISLPFQKDYGRIAAQTAKQVILQRIREAERSGILEEYKSKEGEVISGIVQRIEGRNVFMDIGKTLGILPSEEQAPGEFYRPGQRIKVFVLKVEETSKGPVIFLSRIYPKLISKLFELEVPEVASGQVQIRAIAREPGSRSKVAVESEAEGIDPIGSMVGQRGTRVMAVINELGGEKIDIIEYSSDPEKYVANALSPAKAISVKILPKNKAEVLVPDDQLSLAIGKDGQNVRLAAKLTGWKIDVKGEKLDRGSDEATAEEETEPEETAAETEEAAKEVVEAQEPEAETKEKPAEAEKEAKPKKKKVSSKKSQEQEN